MYTFRADKSNSQESLFVLLVDGTMSMNAHYPIFLKCFHNVFNSIQHKLAFQFGISQDGSDTYLYDVNTFKGHKESNFNKVFKQLFEILITQHLDKKYLTICFISDGVEPFIFDEFLPLVKQITSVFQIQFASIAVGKSFPTLISNQLREKLHNNGNIDFPSIYQVMDLDQIEWIEDASQNVIIHPNHLQQITQEFTNALDSLKQQLIVYTGSIELNELVYKSFIDNPEQTTKVVQCNQVFLAHNPTVQSKNNQKIQCSSNVEDFIQIQRGSIQQLLIHLQANNRIKDSQNEFKKLLDISISSQRILIEIQPQNNQNQIIENPILNVMNKLMDQFVQTNYLASIENKETEYAELQANLENNPSQCVQKCVKYFQKPKEIQIQPIQSIQLEQIKQQKLRNHQQNINEIQLNSKLIMLIDSFSISKQEQEEIMKTKQIIFNQLEKDNILTLWWADTISQNPELNVGSQQLPLTQAIQQILSIIQQDQSGIKNFTIWLIISGQHQVDFLSVNQQQQQIQQQNKQIAFTTLIIGKKSQNINLKISQQRLSLELRRKLHTNYQSHSLQVYGRIETQEFQQYLIQYFRMIKEYQSKFYRIQRIGCYIKGNTQQKNAMYLLKQFINDIEKCCLQFFEDKQLIQNIKQVKLKYYKMMSNFKERQFPDEQYCLAKLNTIFQLIDRINLKNQGDILDEILKIKLRCYDRNQKDFDIKQLNMARNIIKNKNQSSWIKKSVIALGIVYLISTLIQQKIMKQQIK